MPGNIQGGSGLGPYRATLYTPATQMGIVISPGGTVDIPAGRAVLGQALPRVAGLPYDTSTDPDGFLAYPGLSSDWALTTTWTVWRDTTDPINATAEHTHNDADIVATHDSPNGWDMTCAPASGWDSDTRISAGGVLNFDQYPQATVVTVTSPHAAVFGAYYVRYARVFTRAPSYPVNPADSERQNAIYEDVIPTDIDLIIRFPTPILVPPPGSDPGTPADEIYIPFIGGSGTLYATVYYQVAGPGIPNEPYTGSTTGPATSGPPMGVDTTDAAAPSGYNYGFDITGGSITTDQTTWPDNLRHVYYKSALPDGGAIFELTFPLYSNAAGVQHYRVFSAAHFEDYPVLLDQYNQFYTSSESNAAARFGLVDAPSTAPVTSTSNYQSRILPDFAADVIIHVGSSPPPPPPPPSTGPINQRTIAQDLSTGRLSIVSGLPDSSMNYFLYAEVREGWQNLAGAPTRAAGSILGPDGMPVGGQYPHLWKVSEAGVASLVYQDGSGNIVRAESRDGLFTLGAPVS